MVKLWTYSCLYSHFRNYLFKCTDCSEVVCSSVCGEQHIAVPLRDLSGRALGLFDISIGPQQTLPPHQHKDLQRMLKMAQAACSEILKMPSEETKASRVLGIVHTEPGEIVRGKSRNHSKTTSEVSFVRVQMIPKTSGTGTTPEQAQGLSRVPLSRTFRFWLWFTGFPLKSKV